MAFQCYNFHFHCFGDKYINTADNKFYNKMVFQCYFSAIFNVFTIAIAKSEKTKQVLTFTVFKTVL